MITLLNDKIVKAASVVDKNDKRTYVKYITIKGSWMYITDSKILFAFPAEDIPEGLYTIVRKTKKLVEIVMAEELNDYLPDFKAAMCNDDYKYCGVDMVGERAEVVAYHMAREHSACYDFKYVSLIVGMELTHFLQFKGNREGLQVMEDDFKMVLMPIIVEDYIK